MLPSQQVINAGHNLEEARLLPKTTMAFPLKTVLNLSGLPLPPSLSSTQSQASLVARRILSTVVTLSCGYLLLACVLVYAKDNTALRLLAFSLPNAAMVLVLVLMSRFTSNEAYSSVAAPLLSNTALSSMIRRLEALAYFVFWTILVVVLTVHVMYAVQTHVPSEFPLWMGISWCVTQFIVDVSFACAMAIAVMTVLFFHLRVHTWTTGLKRRQLSLEDAVYQHTMLRLVSHAYLKPAANVVLTVAGSLLSLAFLTMVKFGLPSEDNVAPVVVSATLIGTALLVALPVAKLTTAGRKCHVAASSLRVEGYGKANTAHLDAFGHTISATSLDCDFLGVTVSPSTLSWILTGCCIAGLAMWLDAIQET